MSNRLQRKRNREVAAVRAMSCEAHQRPSVNHASGIVTTRSKTLDFKNVAYEVRGEKKFGKVLVRPVTIEVRSAHRQARLTPQGSTGPIRSTIDVVRVDDTFEYKVEFDLPSPNDAADRAAFESLVALRDEEWNAFIKRGAR